MQTTVYLSFKGECEAAFRFYEECLDGKLGDVFRYAGSPMAGQVPEEWQNKIMHASITIGGQVVMGGDVAPQRYEKPQGFSLSLQMTSTTQAERIFEGLAQDGTVMMPLEKTFWAARFGMVIDRFGIPWLINCEETGQRAEG